MKYPILPVALVLALMLIPAGCAQQEPAETPAPETPTVAEVTEAIDEVSLAFETAAASGDAATIASYYTPDAAFHAPGAPPLHGREAIQEALAGMLGEGMVVDLETLDLEVYGNVANEYGTVTFFSPEGDTLVIEPYVVLWKLHDGSWKLHRDFVSGTLP